RRSSRLCRIGPPRRSHPTLPRRARRGALRRCAAARRLHPREGDAGIARPIRQARASRARLLLRAHRRRLARGGGPGDRMRRSALPLAALVLLAELVLLSYRRDASPWQLAVHAAALVGCLVLARRAPNPAHRLALLVVAGAAAGLAALDAATLARGAAASATEISPEAVEAE